MYIKVMSIIAAVVMGGAAILGLGTKTASADSRDSRTPVVSSSTDSSNPEANNAQNKADRLTYRIWRGLVQAAATVTGQEPKDIIQGLKNGQSLADQVVAAGKTVDDLLKQFDEFFNSLISRIEQNTNIPDEKIQQLRTKVQEAVPQIVNSTQLPQAQAPSFDDPMLARRLLIRSAIQVGGLEPTAVRDGLAACKSINDLLVANGHTGQEAVDAAMATLSPRLDKMVEAGKLTQEQRDSLSNKLSAEMSKLVNTPGLRTNQQCAQ